MPATKIASGCTSLPVAAGADASATPSGDHDVTTAAALTVKKPLSLAATSMMPLPARPTHVMALVKMSTEVVER